MKNRHFSKMTDAELAQVIVDANLVKEAMDHPGFVRFILPELTERHKATSDAADWKPGLTCDVPKIAVTSVYNSGRKSALCEPTVIFHEFQADKEEAIKELTHRKEKAAKQK